MTNHDYFPKQFQLTPSRRATLLIPAGNKEIIISTHALTEGDKGGEYMVAEKDISTHALTEGDLSAPFCTVPTGYFNSRPHGGRQDAFCE